MRWVAVSICGAVLALGVASGVASGDEAVPVVPAAPVVPVEGPWHAMTSAGLPVAFEVTAGQIVGARFRFKWGFCGSFESHAGPPVPIEAGGHWKFADPSGPWIEATFVAPGRAEGTVAAPSRMTPGCPPTSATFVAEPGAAPFAEAETAVIDNVVSRHLAHAPKGMLLKRAGSIRFYGLHWHGFGESVARANGRAYLRSGDVVRRPKVNLTLSELTEQGDLKVYLQLRYRFLGPVPPGFRHRGGRFFD
jgi:hypothetical protein